MESDVDHRIAREPGRGAANPNPSMPTARRIDKVTIGSVRLMVAALLFTVGLALALGWPGRPA